MFCPKLTRIFLNFYFGDILKLKIFSKITLKGCLLAALGSIILAFGLYNVHSFSKVTEGGILGLELLFDHWFNISPAVSGLVMNAVCYIIGLALLGGDFIIYSLVSGGLFSLSYAIFELFPPIYPDIGKYPLLAAVLGAVFVGVGVGISVRSGGAPGGDDALALSLSKITKLKIEWIYFIFDISVLGLSLSYIPLKRILFSLLSVLISSKLVGIIQRLEWPKRKQKPNL